MNRGREEERKQRKKQPKEEQNDRRIIETESTKKETSQSNFYRTTTTTTTTAKTAATATTTTTATNTKTMTTTNYNDDDSSSSSSNNSDNNNNNNNNRQTTTITHLTLESSNRGTILFMGSLISSWVLSKPVAKSYKREKSYHPSKEILPRETEPRVGKKTNVFWKCHKGRPFWCIPAPLHTVCLLSPGSVSCSLQPDGEVECTIR